MGRARLRPLPAPCAGDGPGPQHPSEGCAAAVSSRPPGGDAVGEGTRSGSRPGSGSGSSPRIPAARAPGGGALGRLYFFFFVFFLSLRGVVGGGEGALCVSL